MQRLASLALAAAAACPLSAQPWKVPGDFATIQAAVDSPLVGPGDTIKVRRGSHDGAVLTKAVRIEGIGGATISGGPLFFSRGGVDFRYGFLLAPGSDGCVITSLAFTTAFPVFSRGHDDVTVTHCTFDRAIQAVSNWGGSRWRVAHNVFTDLRTLCGGGIAILLGDFALRRVKDNLVEHNIIRGALRVSPTDCGGYNGTGIVMFSDNRFGRSGALEISGNIVAMNKVALTLVDPREPGVGAPIDVVAFELTDTSGSVAVIRNNAIGFNDFRGTATAIALTPAGLAAHNTISRNLGSNRGQGSHPSAFVGR